nr:unnamed protein product [Spirometra erinaceieuropaei]
MGNDQGCICGEEEEEEEEGEAASLTLIILAVWKVRFLLNNPTANHLRGRTALAAWELAYCEVGVAALEGTSFFELGQVLMSSAVLMVVHRTVRPRIDMNYQTDEKLSDVRLLKASSWVSMASVHDLLYADDSTTEEDTQRGVEILAYDLSNPDFTITTKKTVPFS